MEHFIRQFKAVPIQTKEIGDFNREITNKTLEIGFVFAPEVLSSYNKEELNKLIKDIKKNLFLSSEEMNQTFHKSWKKVRDSPIGKLVMEQVLHYFTTYGFERMGIYSKDSVYIPQEELDLPHMIDPIEIMVIKGYTLEEFKEKTIKVVNSGIALKKETLDDFMSILIDCNIKEDEITAFKNRELKAMLYDLMGIVPENPVEFLRYVIYKTLGTSLLIKDKKTYYSLKESDGSKLSKYFHFYKTQYGLENLASIFFRYKSLFLAMRVNDKMKAYTNRLRKLADSFHVPLEEDLLNNVTSCIKKRSKVDFSRLNNALKKANTFRKIRLAYALKYRMSSPESILFKIRNGKAYAKEFKFENKASAEIIYTTVMSHIIKDIQKNVFGKKIYIPERVNYALPATEKQFLGNVPFGTSIKAEKDMIVGVHWKNRDDKRIDLDLSMIDSKRKIGWDGMYRSNKRSILFSGDITDAPKPLGATESFYIGIQEKNENILNLNYFNFEEEKPVEFNLFVAKEHPESFKKNYTVRPYNILFNTKINIDTHQKVLGLVITEPTETTFYIMEASIGRTISSSNTPTMVHSRNYLIDSTKSSIELKEVLRKAGGVLVEDRNNADLDLSPESLEKDTLLKLIIG